MYIGDYVILQKKIIPFGEKNATPKGFERKDVRKMFREFNASKERGNAELVKVLTERNIDITADKKTEIATHLEEVAPKESCSRKKRNVGFVLTPIFAAMAWGHMKLWEFTVAQGVANHYDVARPLKEFLGISMDAMSWFAQSPVTCMLAVATLVSVIKTIRDTVHYKKNMTRLVNKINEKISPAANATTEPEKTMLEVI